MKGRHCVDSDRHRRAFNIHIALRRGLVDVDVQHAAVLVTFLDNIIANFLQASVPTN